MPQTLYPSGVNVWTQSKKVLASTGLPRSAGHAATAQQLSR